MKTHKLTLIGLFTAFLCILGPIAIILPFSPVPLSLGTLGVLLACLLLGTKNGLLCTILYLILGFVGLPVFTSFTGGAGKLLGPTGGYLLGYLLLASVGGSLAGRWEKKIVITGAGALSGNVLLLPAWQLVAGLSGGHEPECSFVGGGDSLCAV